MTEKEKRQRRRSAEDAAFNRMLLWLVGAVIAEAVALFVKRFYINMTGQKLDLAIATVLYNVFPVLTYVGLILTVLGVIWCILAAKKGKGLKLPGILTAVVAFLWIVSLLSWFLDEAGVKILVALPIVAVVLVLIYFLYPRSFFANALVSGCGMLGLWVFRQFHGGHPTVVTVLFVLGLVGLIVLAALALMLRKHDGKLGKHQLVADRKCYPAFWLTCGVVFVAAVLALLLGVGAAYYLLYALIGWLFCLAVYYTVKMM